MWKPRIKKVWIANEQKFMWIHTLSPRGNWISAKRNKELEKAAYLFCKERNQHLPVKIS